MTEDSQGERKEQAIDRYLREYEGLTRKQLHQRDPDFFAELLDLELMGLMPVNGGGRHPIPWNDYQNNHRGEPRERLHITNRKLY